MARKELARRLEGFHPPALFCFLPSISNFMPFQHTTFFQQKQTLKNNRKHYYVGKPISFFLLPTNSYQSHPPNPIAQKRVIFNKKRKRGKTLGPFFLPPFVGLGCNLASRYRGLYLTICYFQICGFLVKVFSEGLAMIIVKCN